GSNIATLMGEIGERARSVARVLALATTAQKDRALAAMAAAIRARKAQILGANAEDMAEAKASGATSAFLDRLALDERRVAAMAAGVDAGRALAPRGAPVTEGGARPNGMRTGGVGGPFGVAGTTYESRPTATADAASLCVKAGNAAILRGGS